MSAKRMPERSLRIRGLPSFRSLAALRAGAGAHSSRPPALCRYEDYARRQRPAEGNFHVGVGGDSNEIPVSRPVRGRVLRAHSGRVEGEGIRQAIPVQTGVSGTVASRNHPEKEAWVWHPGGNLDEIRSAY